MVKQKHITLTPTQHSILMAIIRRSTSPQRAVFRSRLVVQFAATGNVSATAVSCQADRKTVRLWLTRWIAHVDQLADYERRYLHPAPAVPFSLADYQAAITAVLSDAPRPGAPATITEVQKQQIIALAAQKPADAGVPVTHWSHELLACTAVDKAIVNRISSSHVGRFLKPSHTKAPSQPVLGAPEH